MEILESSFLALPLISSTSEHVVNGIYRVESVNDKIFKFKRQNEKGSYWEEITCEFLYLKPVRIVPNRLSSRRLEQKIK